jgi:hypothetical protein
MPLQTSASQTGPAEAYTNLRTTAFSAKVTMQSLLSSMQGGNIDSNFAFNVLDLTRGHITNLNRWQGVSGLDAYATAQGYSGSMSSDTGACITAAQAVITWAVNNFPSAGGFLQAQSLNADGTRTLRQFTSTQTAGWQTVINNFIATID